MAEPSQASLRRRTLLKQGAAGLLLGFSFTTRRATAARGEARLNAFIRITPDDRTILIMPAVEMGQGVYTSQSMCLAEELDVGLDQVVLEHAPEDQADYGNPIYVGQLTGGSTTTQGWYSPLRKAGAAARSMLVQAAAQLWSVEAASLRTARGVVHHDPTGRSLPYGALATHAAVLPAPSDPALKDPRDFRLIGTSAPRLDTADKATGKTRFGIDVMLPGMAFATLAACPTFGGGVRRIEDTAAKAVPGVRQGRGAR